jgi:metal-responsive CopG/Arc/MetJ family transcriptional regulator
VDEHTLAALNRIASPGKRKRADFVRRAIRKAIRRVEYRAMREPYRKQPDFLFDAEDWSTPEEFHA